MHRLFRPLAVVLGCLLLSACSSNESQTTSRSGPAVVLGAGLSSARAQTLLNSCEEGIYGLRQQKVSGTDIDRLKPAYASMCACETRTELKGLSARQITEWLDGTGDLPAAQETRLLQALKLVFPRIRACAKPFDATAGPVLRRYGAFKDDKQL